MLGTLYKMEKIIPIILLLIVIFTQGCKERFNPDTYICGYWYCRWQGVENLTMCNGEIVNIAGNYQAHPCESYQLDKPLVRAECVQWE